MAKNEYRCQLRTRRQPTWGKYLKVAAIPISFSKFDDAVNCALLTIVRFAELCLRLPVKSKDLF
jgi:hypothetical protein